MNTSMLSLGGLRWSLAVLLCLGAAVRLSAKTEYMAVLIDGKKIGHAEMSREVSGGKVTTASVMEFNLSRLGAPMTVRATESSVETEKGEPLSFKTEMDMAIAKQGVEGRIRNGQVEVTTTTGGQSQTRTLPWPEGALLSEGARIEADKHGLKPGTKYRVKMFEQTTLQAVDADVEVGAVREVDLLGRVVRLTEVKTTMRVGQSEMPSVSFVDEHQDVQKSILSMMGLKLELVACSREFALSPHDLVDLLNKVIMPSPAPLKNVRSARSVTYHLQPIEPDKPLRLPTTGSQTVAAPVGGQTVVTVRRLVPKTGEAFPYQGTDKAALEALKPEQYVESDRPEIKALAKRAVVDAQDSAAAVQKIESFVAGYITAKDLSVGYASAAEVAASRQGDCTEHAVLATALCRAVGIPARVVVGIAYVDEYGGRKAIFVPHAWSQAYVGGQWIDFDAALRGFNAGHLTLSVGGGSPQDFFEMINALGAFKIVKVAETAGAK